MIYSILIDIDGTLIEQVENYIEAHANGWEDKVLRGTLEKLKEWDKKCYRIILTTARRESSRKATEEMLAKLGIAYDQLIMGIGIGPRVIINDLKPESDAPMAIAINLKRNQGISEIDI